MHFSITCGLFLCVTMLLFLPVQGQLDPDVGTDSSPCCTQVSSARIKQRVKRCYEQQPNAYYNCKVRAYIFVTENGERYCVNPSAKWVKKRLNKLKRRGIYCSPL